MEYKKLFIEKYNYLYKNAGFFCIEKIEEDTIIALQQVLLECKSLIDIDGFKYLENLKTSKDYFGKYKQAVMFNNLLNKLSNKTGLGRENNIIRLCQLVYDNIDKEDNDKVSIRKRKDVIDEFARVSRYSNDETIWTSGVYLNNKDINNRKMSIFGMMDINKEKEKSPMVVENNQFIDFFSNDYIYNKNFDIRMVGISQEFFVLDKDRAYHFTEKEKQKIFKNNKKFNYTMICGDNEEIQNESQYCLKSFDLDKRKIYMTKDNKILIICPNCGCINVVPIELLDSYTMDYLVSKYNKIEEYINMNNSVNKTRNLK